MIDMHTRPQGHPRSWRRLGLAGASLAVIAVIGATTANQAVADDTQRTPQGVSAAAPDQANVADAQPTSHRRVAGIQALDAALSRVVPEGAVADRSAMSYEPSRDGWPNAYGHLTFAPSSGAAASDVMVSYWPLKPGDAELHSSCPGLVDDCETVTLPDGSVVVSYVVSNAGVAPGLGASTLIAVHRVVGGNVVTLASGSPQAQPGVPAAHPALTRDQLVGLISQPEWTKLRKA